MLRSGMLAALLAVAPAASITVDAPVATLLAPLQVPAGLADGDLVFRTGRDIMARLVLAQGESPRFSHVGLITLKNGEIFVIHAIPGEGDRMGGVQMEPLVSFAAIENASDVGFYRVKGINAATRQKIRDYAMQQIGKPFDNQFMFSDDSQFYCTELVLKALASGDLDLSPSIQHVDILTLTEPVFPPDYLRRSFSLESMEKFDGQH